MMDWAGGTRPAAAQGDVNEQGSPAWLAWRKKGIGSSDAAVLLGLSPWKDVVELYEEKLGITTPVFGFAQQKAMDRGKRLEPHFRKWYEEMVGSPFPDDTAEHKVFPFMRASFDGRNKTARRGLEIKAPNAKDHALAVAGHVPEKYMPQCQWLMLIGDCVALDYVSGGYCGGDDPEDFLGDLDRFMAVVTVHPDLAMQKELIERARKFWYCIENRVEPNLLDFQKYYSDLSRPLDLGGGQMEIPAIASQEIEATVAEALRLQADLAALEAKFSAVKERLKAIAGDRDKVEHGEAVFGWQTRKGLVDYGSIPELKSMDLDRFRKPETRAFYFKRKEQKK